MKKFTDIRKIYPNAIYRYSDGEEYFGGVYDYNPLLQSFDYEIIIQVDDHDYQGDSRLLFRDVKDRYGILIFGWGSCSGCDSLQGCSSFEELEELRKELHNDITWKDSDKDMLQYMTEKDWELEWCWHYKETKAFIGAVIGYLEGITGKGNPNE